MNIHFLRTSLCLVLLASTSLHCSAEDAAQKSPLAGKRPNIIFVLTDDQGYGDASCNGNPVLKTPNIDRMHKEGVHFEDFRVSPTCSPTRSALMSGKHEFHNGVTHTIFERERMSLKTTTIAQILKSSGYTTGIFGKWHLGDEAERWPSKRGFDEMFIHGAGGIGQGYPGTCGDVPGNKYMDPVILHNGTFEKTSGYCTDVFFGQALKWIELKKDKAKEPFFAYIATNAPHLPLQCPHEYYKQFEGKFGDGAQGLDTAKYFGMVTNIDDNLGKLLDKVKEWKLEENTLIIFMNDNGGVSGCHIYNAGMMGTKNTSHNGGTRAMSLWRWPGAIKPASCSKLTAHIDFFPTIAELVGAKVPDEVANQLEGHSLLPLLSNPESQWDDERVLFTHVGRWKPGAEPEKYGQCSMRYKQFLQFRSKSGWQLFDVIADPGEKTNLAEKHPEIIAKLDKAYDEWWKNTLPLLENEEAATHLTKINPMKALYWKQFNGPGPNNVPPPKADEKATEK